MFGPDKLRRRIHFARQCFERGAFGPVADDDEARLRVELGAGAEEQIEFLAGLQTSDEK